MNIHYMALSQSKYVNRAAIIREMGGLLTLPAPAVSRSLTAPGEAAPKLISPLIRKKDIAANNKREVFDVLNSTIPDFTTAGDILTFRGQTK